VADEAPVAITLYSSKGGSGSSTLAVNLAAFLARKGETYLLPGVQIGRALLLVEQVPRRGGAGRPLIPGELVDLNMDGAPPGGRLQRGADYHWVNRVACTMTSGAS